ncbi:MAG: GntR family transcriptional regulator [Rhodobacteraceae bacterium]|nr:GntR family transcriptional regulator [Paracoccaceae bacterium]
MTVPANRAAHDRIFRILRSEIMQGEIAPGCALTIRGIAERFGVSMTPAREAVRRLGAEGALTPNKAGRVTVPQLSGRRIEELAAIRALLEPELAGRARPRAHMALIKRLAQINATCEQANVQNDAAGYVRANLEFHHTLYLRAQAPAILALVETVWLQLGPTMCASYARLQGAGATAHHRKAIAALKTGDEAVLKEAIRADVTRDLHGLDGHRAGF